MSIMVEHFQEGSCLNSNCVIQMTVLLNIDNHNRNDALAPPRPVGAHRDSVATRLAGLPLINELRVGPAVALYRSEKQR